MRSTLVAVAFVASTIAVPFQKRDVVTDVDMVYVTDIVTVTATGDEPTAIASSSEASSTSISVAQAPAHYGHHSYHWSTTSEAEPVKSTSTSEYVAPVASSTSQYVAPSSTSTYVAPSPTSTYVAPPPTSTYVAPPPTSTYVAPPSTSTSAYVAPTSTSTYVAPSSVYVASTTAAAPTVSPSPAAPTSYQDIAVYHHNLHRANHSAPDIEWDAGLASTAAIIASSCVYAHDTTTNGGGYGQNIAAGVEPANISAIITDMFYNGEVNWFNGLYGAANPDMTNFEHWGHFSQIVWKASTKLGCATQYCPGGLANTGSDVSPYFTVCNYASPGNFGGEYGDNIGASLNKASIDWNAGGIS